MKEENEIVDELDGLDGELKSFPAEAHWFCPKQRDDDPIDYENPDEGEEDTSVETKRELIQDAKRRHNVAYKYSLILGMDPEHSGRLREDYIQRLDQLLKACDKCVHNWHLGRKAFLKECSEQFDDDTVTELSDRLDSIDFLRLDNGLESAEKLLARVDPAQRTQAVLAKNDSAALLALYEALCCVNYHKSNDRLAKHFDYVFEQIQSRKILRIGDILPAMARFLFSRNQFRHRFATNAWQKMSSELTVKTFEWVITDVLTEAIMLVSMPSADPEDVLRFWQGFSLMLERMDKGLITHSLRGMEVQPDIFYLALQHLSCNSETIVTLVIDTLRRFLIKSPKDLWSAFGAVSPATVAEQIFRSPGFEKMLSNPKTFETFETSPATSWIVVLLKSLDPIHQYDACRSMLFNLFERLQENSFPEGARLACCRVGLDAIHTTLQTFITSDYKINPSTSLIVINNIMGLVDQYKGTIVGCAGLEDKEDGNQQLKNLGMVVIKDALALDCKATSAEFYALENGTPVQRGDRSHSQSIWQAVLDIFRPGNMELAKSILPATSTLIGLDELHPEAKKRPLPKDHIQFNKDLHELMDNIARIFERLSDFSTSDLMKMHMDPVTSRPLFAALISADEGISQAAVEVVKAATSQSGKRDAIQSMLESAFIPFLNSITYAVIRTCKAKTFGPIPFMVKTGREILKALCGNTGILRTHSTFTTAEQNSIMMWWTNQWKALDHIFSTTESWAKRVDRPSAEMQDFCRDCMEYAELLFNEYNIFASALRELSPSDDELTSGKSSASMVSHRKVLEVICLNINGLVGMLRLRDSYLVTVITSLLGKLLRCLGEYQLEVADYALEYITDACKRDDEHPIRKTNLTNQQKAELLRALDEHQGVEVIEISRPSVFKKQGTIDAWTKSGDGMQHEPKLPSKSHALPMASSSEKNKAILEKMRAQEALKSQSIDVFKEKRRKVEEERNRVKAEAVARAQAMRTATVRGEGSGIKDIGGVFGKDHAPPRSEIMVGSSDEDSDDDADEDETNALVKTRKERSSKALEIEESRRRAQMKQPEGPVKKTKVQRSAKDLRARVEPNMDGLYFEILSWDIFHHGDTPPSNNECRKIDNTYLDLDLYKKTFGPLLISEIWRSLVTAKEENNFKPIEIKVLNRLSVDKFLEVTTSIPMSLNRDLKLSERDIVLLSRGSDPLGNEQEPHCLARVDRTTRKKDRIEVTMRVSRDINPAFLQCLFPNGKIYGVKIADMTTAQREFAALSSLEYYDLCSEVLEAKPSPIHKYGDEKISQVTAKYSLNKGQAQAILSANDNDGFTLIQGPPGSGKTKTIVAMVGALLTPILQQQKADQAKVRPPVQGQKAPEAPAPKKKLLICAPSNAAVDELVVRLKEGVQPLSGPRQKINVIRIGRSDAINADVKDVMLDELVRMKLEGDNGEQNKLIKEKDDLHKKAAQIKERRNVLFPLLEEAQKNNDKATQLTIQRELDLLKRNQATIGAKIDEDKENGNTATRQNEINRRRYQQEILDGAHVLCATLSGSGHDMFRNLNVEFETVIIDEAAQCIELSALIPLKYGCSKCILVGDPEQLPPTVLSRSAQSFGYEQSLFVRMQKNHPKDVHLLDTQYRMHPEISRFPSQQFYNSRLVDGEGMANLRRKPWHASTILGPYRFFDVKGVQTKQVHGHSFINVQEINAAIGLYERLKADYRGIDFKGKIGIIATYKAQLNELKARFSGRYGDAIFDEIEFNTTDAFQGREREIIIFSCVRAKETGGIGFLGDIRRMNVGLTRAKSSLWVLGDSRSLQQGEFWNRLIVDSQTRNRYTGGDVMALLSKPTVREQQQPEAPLRQPNGNTNQSLPARVKAEDNDIEMLDTPPLPGSRKPSLSGSNGAPAGNKVNGGDLSYKQELRRPSLGGVGGALGIKTGSTRPRDISIKEENQTLSVGESSTATEINAHGKRSRESSAKSEDSQAKKAHTLNNEKISDLEAALRAQEAAKAKPPSTARPVRPPGVAPPRKRPVADPFIQRKPPKRG